MSCHKSYTIHTYIKRSSRFCFRRKCWYVHLQVLIFEGLGSKLITFSHRLVLPTAVCLVRCSHYSSQLFCFMATFRANYIHRMTFPRCAQLNLILLYKRVYKYYIFNTLHSVVIDALMFYIKLLIS